MLQPQSTTLDGLPKRFVFAMRKLFDIMDDKKTGYVKFSDIEQWWQDDGTKGLPKGVIDSLQKVTPSNGLLSFERFCAGLKICLLRNQVDPQKTQIRHPDMDTKGKIQPKRPPSAPLLDLQETVVKSQWTNTATVCPNNAISGQRTNSMPQLLPGKNEVCQLEMDARNFPTHVPHMNHASGMILYGPPKPPRTAQGLERAAMNAMNSNADRNMDNRMPLTERTLNKAEIRTVLQNWQKNILLNDQELEKSSTGYHSGNMTRSSGDGKSSGYIESMGTYKKMGPRKREPRRHTLQNGIDYNMLKRIKQIEQEKDVLMQGLTAVERAREWYLKQVAIVQEKMKYLGRAGSHTEQWSEAQAEKLELQKARVLEVNRHLTTLTESWEKGGLPLHMNLAVHHLAPTDILARIKRQNRLLSKEISQKSERISVLEQEKAGLVRELYQTRALLQSRNTEDVPIHDKMDFM